MTPSFPAPEFWGVPLDQIADVGANGREDPTLISHEIIFKVLLHMYPIVTDRQTVNVPWQIGQHLMEVITKTSWFVF